MRYIRTAALISGCLLTACADPVMVPPVGEAEGGFSCEQLASELAAAREAEHAARADDRAKPSYLLIVPAYVSWYRMDQAEEAARQRQMQLEKLYASRGCPPLNAAVPPLPSPGS